MCFSLAHIDIVGWQNIIDVREEIAPTAFSEFMVQVAGHAFYRFFTDSFGLLFFLRVHACSLAVRQATKGTARKPTGTSVNGRRRRGRFHRFLWTQGG